MNISTSKMQVAKCIKSRRGRRAAIKPPSNTEQSDAALQEALDITDIHLDPIEKGVHDTEPTNPSPIEVLHNQHLDCAFHKDFGTGSLLRLKESIESYLSDPVGVHLAELRCHCFEFFKISHKVQIHRELLRRPAFFDDAEIIMLGGCCSIADQWIFLSLRWSAVHERGVSLVVDTMSLEEPPKLENHDQNVDEKVALSSTHGLSGGHVETRSPQRITLARHWLVPSTAARQLARSVMVLGLV
jgi:hypothetical protein